jgi:hypothetical protein
MCGIALPVGLMVPDGGQACADIRWYFKDAKSCTERWTSRPRRLAVAPSTRDTLPGAGDPRPAGAPPALPAGAADGTEIGSFRPGGIAREA